MTYKNNLLAALVAASLSFSAQSLFAQNDPASNGATQLQQSQQQSEAKPCRWWQFGHCANANEASVEGLPSDAPREGTVITVDVSTNTAYLFNDGALVAKAPAATGTGKILKKGRKIWAFHTPRGHLKVLRKIQDPIWTKPDWAFVEAGEPVPPPGSKERQVKGHLGKYALDLGDGIMIHGTDEIDSLGRKASHGCIRLGEEMLTKLWQSAPVGTSVFIYDSEQQPQSTTAQSNVPEHHSDLDVR